MLKNWLKGFAVALVIMTAVFFVLFIVQLGAFTAGKGEITMSVLMWCAMLSWFALILVLMPKGSVPLKMTSTASFARFIFVWSPVSIGWYLMYQDAPIWTFFAGMFLSSTCAGYNMMATRRKEIRDRQP